MSIENCQSHVCDTSPPAKPPPPPAPPLLTLSPSPLPIQPLSIDQLERANSDSDLLNHTAVTTVSRHAQASSSCPRQCHTRYPVARSGAILSPDQLTAMTPVSLLSGAADSPTRSGPAPNSSRLSRPVHRFFVDRGLSWMQQSTPNTTTSAAAAAHSSSSSQRRDSRRRDSIPSRTPSMSSMVSLASLQSTWSTTPPAVHAGRRRRTFASVAQTPVGLVHSRVRRHSPALAERSPTATQSQLRHGQAHGDGDGGGSAEGVASSLSSHTQGASLHVSANDRRGDFSGCVYTPRSPYAIRTMLSPARPLPNTRRGSQHPHLRIEGELWYIAGHEGLGRACGNTQIPLHADSPHPQWVVCENQRLSVYSSWGSSSRLLAHMPFEQVRVLFYFRHHHPHVVQEAAVRPVTQRSGGGAEGVSSDTRNTLTPPLSQYTDTGKNRAPIPTHATSSSLVSAAAATSVTQTRPHSSVSAHETRENQPQRGTVSGVLLRHGHPTPARRCGYYYFGVEGYYHARKEGSLNMNMNDGCGEERHRMLILFATDRPADFRVWLDFWRKMAGREALCRWPCVTSGKGEGVMRETVTALPAQGVKSDTMNEEESNVPLTMPRGAEEEEEEECANHDDRETALPAAERATGCDVATNTERRALVSVGCDALCDDTVCRDVVLAQEKISKAVQTSDDAVLKKPARHTETAHHDVPHESDAQHALHYESVRPHGRPAQVAWQEMPTRTCSSPSPSQSLPPPPLCTAVSSSADRGNVTCAQWTHELVPTASDTAYCPCESRSDSPAASWQPRHTPRRQCNDTAETGLTMEAMKPCASERTQMQATRMAEVDRGNGGGETNTSLLGEPCWMGGSRVIQKTQHQDQHPQQQEHEQQQQQQQNQDEQHQDHHDQQVVMIRSEVDHCINTDDHVDDHAIDGTDIMTSMSSRITNDDDDRDAAVVVAAAGNDDDTGIPDDAAGTHHTCTLSNMRDKEQHVSRARRTLTCKSRKMAHMAKNRVPVFTPRAMHRRWCAHRVAPHARRPHRSSLSNNKNENDEEDDDDSDSPLRRLRPLDEVALKHRRMWQQSIARLGNSTASAMTNNDRREPSKAYDDAASCRRTQQRRRQQQQQQQRRRKVRGVTGGTPEHDRCTAKLTDDAHTRALLRRVWRVAHDGAVARQSVPDIVAAIHRTLEPLEKAGNTTATRTTHQSDETGVDDENVQDDDRPMHGTSRDTHVDPLDDAEQAHALAARLLADCEGDLAYDMLRTQSLATLIHTLHARKEVYKLQRHELRSLWQCERERLGQCERERKTMQHRIMQRLMSMRAEVRRKLIEDEVAVRHVSETQRTMNVLLDRLCVSHDVERAGLQG